MQAENPRVHKGRYHPEECKALQRVAILIPHRNREKHLMYLLEHLHPFLQRQQLEYGIYIIHQVSVGADLVSASRFSSLWGTWPFVSLGSKEHQTIVKGAVSLFILERSKGNSCPRMWSNETGNFYCLINELLEEDCFAVRPSMLAKDCPMTFPWDLLSVSIRILALYHTMISWNCFTERGCSLGV